MGFTSTVALRFLRSRRSRFVSLITIIAVLSITIGVMVLNVTLAVMNGFRDQIQLKFVENMPMVTVIAPYSGFKDLDQVVARTLRVPGVLAASPFLRKEGVVTLERLPGQPRHRGIILWGIDPQRQEQVTPLSKSIDPPFHGFSTEGLVGAPAGTPGIVLGQALAEGLRGGLGDVVTVTVARGSGGLGQFKSESREFQVVGLLSSGMYDFDSAFGYIDLAAAQNLFQMPGGADGIGARVREMMRAAEVGTAIEDSLGAPPYFTNNWISMNSQLFDWIRMEKTMMFLLLSLITLVASFSVVAILTMMVRDRQRDIGILMSIGVSKARLVGIFVQLGMLLGLGGVVTGTAFGYCICRILDAVGLPLPGDVYFVNTLPVHMKLGDFSLVASVTLGMSFLATLLPSWLASRFTPVEVLRYE
jgi:lipoprotein-releasing system permease protein